MIRKVKWVWLGIFMTILWSKGMKAQETFAIETNLVYYFTKYVDWPNSIKSENFVIGVYGADKIYDELNTQITNRRVGNKRIVVKKIDRIDFDNVKVNILFLGSAKINSLNKVIKLTEKNPVLLVTQKSGMIDENVCMNINLSDNKVRLEINEEIINSKGLKIAVELLNFDKSRQQ